MIVLKLRVHGLTNDTNLNEDIDSRVFIVRDRTVPGRAQSQEQWQAATYNARTLRPNTLRPLLPSSQHNIRPIAFGLDYKFEED